MHVFYLKQLISLDFRIVDLGFFEKKVSQNEGNNNNSQSRDTFKLFSVFNEHILKYEVKTTE